MTFLGRVCAILAFGLLACSAAQAADAVPKGMTTEQFNAVVDAASRAVIDKIGKPEAAGPSAPEAGDLTHSVGVFVSQAAAAFRATGELSDRLASIPGLLLQDSSSRGLTLYVVLLILTAALALSAEWLLRRATAVYREALAIRDGVGLSALWPLAGLAGLDAVGLGAVWLVSYGAVGVWFQGEDGQARLARALLVGLFNWRLYMLAFRIALRPELSAARLAPLTDAGAGLVYGRISIVVLLAIATRITTIVLSAIGTSVDGLAAFQIYGAILLFAILFNALYATRAPMARWLSGLLGPRSAAGLREDGARWLAVACPFFLLLFLAQIYGAVEHRTSVPQAMILTMNLALALIFFETVRAFLTRPAAMDAPTATTRNQLLSALILRCLRVAALIVIAATIVQTWAVDVLGLIDANAWRAATHASVTVGATLFCAFVAWELVRYATARYITLATPAGAPADEDAGPPPGATRLATLAPLIRVAASIGIVIIATLLVLTELGVNVTPLIAGASVLGLAVSFGSQTLVKDIVSGMFYLADDAFRVGEYIDCGKAKGTVEGFTLRSIKLRHQNGQVHTIPFGQLGQITNFSRDWATVKFNLRLARNVDLEKVRKAVKKVGLAMLEDPELKDDFLSPVKLQGVADVQDNAMIVRVKFTVKPVNPSYIQRLAVKKIVDAFAENGIEFASSTVAVQTIGGADVATAAGAAAAVARARNAEAVAAGA